MLFIDKVLPGRIDRDGDGLLHHLLAGLGIRQQQFNHVGVDQRGGNQKEQHQEEHDVVHGPGFDVRGKAMTAG